MRNLKRILSAALAMVMSLSIATVASAAVDFDDAADINYDEAVAVMSTIGVLEGYNGEFDPAGSLTREQAAKIVAYMLLGDNANKLSVSDSRYTDVAANRWSAGVIEYCSEMGILAGNGDGTYNPEGKLTGYAFAKMLLGALGYSADIEGFTGSAWTLNVARYAMEIGLDDGIEDIDWAADITREEAAQMAMNAVKSPLVQYDKGATIIIDGQKVTFGSGDAYYVTSTLAKEQRISSQKLTNSDNYTVEFGERYFPKLEMKGATDDFERPAHTWIYNGEEIGTYVDYTNLVQEYTTSVKGKEMYDLLGKSLVTDEDYTLTVYVDGAEYEANDKNASRFIMENFTRNNVATMDNTGNGVLTQVFVDSDAEEVLVCIQNTYLAEATSDYNKTTERLSVRVYNNGTGTTKTMYLDDFAAIEDVKEGDFMLVSWAGDTTNTNSKAIVAMSDVEVMSDVKVSKFSIGNYVTVDGTQYDFAESQAYDSAVLNDYDQGLLTNKTYNVYLDQYGYVAGIDLYSGEANYVFITGYDMKDSNISTQTAKAAAIFVDGKMETIDVNVKATNDNIKTFNDNSSHDYKMWNTDNQSSKINTWYTYTLDESNSVYTLNVVDPTRQLVTGKSISAGGTGAVTINTKSVRLDGTNDAVDGDTVNVRAYGNDDSAYITVDTETVTIGGKNNVIDSVTGLYTGVQKVDITSRDNVATGTVFAVVDSKDYVIAAVVIGEDNGATTNYTYIFAGAKSEEKKGDTYYWEFDAVTSEGIQTLTVKTKYQSVIQTIESTLAATNAGSAAGKTYANGYLFKLSYDADGYVVNAKKYDDSTLVNTYIFENNASGWDTAITNQVVRYMNVDAADGDELVLIGNTLYNGDQTNDVGLPLHPDAKFVVAQVEYGKFVKTEYDSIEAALSALYDYNQDNNNVKETLDFNGTISAVLDNSGRATWVVFDSNGGFNADQNPSNKPSNDGKLVLNSLVFSGGGMQVNFTNKTGSALMSGATADVVVKNEKGAQVCSLTGQQVTVGSIADNASGTITFSGYTATPSNTGTYTVELTIHCGHGNFTVTQELGTV